MLTVKLLCLQFLKALLDALSHCKQKAPTVRKEAKIVSKEAKIVSKKGKSVHCKYKSSTVSRKLPTVSKKAASLKISSEPPTKPLFFFVGNSEGSGLQKNRGLLCGSLENFNLD